MAGKIASRPGTTNPWQPLVDRFEQAVLAATLQKPQIGQPASETVTGARPLLGWHDELRALELDDAARRSLERGRSSTLDLQEVTRKRHSRER